MQFIIVTLATLFTTAQPGNLCLAATYASSPHNTYNLYAFAAGSPCVDGKKQQYEISVHDICGHLPYGINICGQNGNLVKLSDKRPKAPFGCAIGFETGGKVHQGELQLYGPDKGSAHNGPCDASCGLKGLDGFLHFVGVPLGFCS